MLVWQDHTGHDRHRLPDSYVTTQAAIASVIKALLRLRGQGIKQVGPGFNSLYWTRSASWPSWPSLLAATSPPRGLVSGLEVAYRTATSVRLKPPARDRPGCIRSHVQGS